MQVGDYVVKPTCIREENCLINFLKRNNFKYEEEFENDASKCEYLIVINIIYRIYFKINRYFIHSNPISEKEFLEKINYDYKKHPSHKRLYSNDGDLLYEGYADGNNPWGLGTVYYSNGNKYKEGLFGSKGLREGKEYYSNGQVKFEGIFKGSGYGPLSPRLGNYYSRNGKLIFSGKFEIKFGGVGYPMMKYPRYRFEEKDAPKIKYK